MIAYDRLLCNNNQLTTLDVSTNIALESLDCNDNQLTILDVSTNTALTRLDCGYNQLTTLDVSTNTALAALRCHYNQLTTLDVSTNTALDDLYCYNNQLTTLDVSTNTALTWLDCNNNKLTALDVSTNIALEGLHCYNNQLTALDLKNLPQLSLTILSPQRSDVVIPVVKHLAYEVDATAFSGRSNAAIDGQPLGVDGKVMIPTRPNAATYTFEADSPVLSDERKTVTVEAKNFAYSYLAILDAGINGTLTFDGTPSPSGEILLAENSTPTFTVTPVSGYQAATLTVNGADKKGSLVPKDAISQTLTLPAVTDFVVVSVMFEEITTPSEPPVDPTDPVDPPTPPVGPTDPVDPIDPPTPPVDPTDPVDPPKPPVDPTDPPKPPVDPTDPADPTDPVDPPIPPVVPDNGDNNGNGNNNGGGTTIVERTNTVTAPAAPETLATPATIAAKTEAPAQAAADNATPQGQLENPTLGAKSLDLQHSHIPLILLLLAVWLVGGFTVDRQRKRTRDAIEGASY